MSNVAVVILNWNGKKHLEKFLPSVVQHSSSASIIVIDNGSTDDSVQFIENNCSGIRVIALDRNYGFCEGYNRGIDKIAHEFTILLNSDVEVTANWIEPLIEILKSDAQIAACQPKILSFKDKRQFEYAGAAGGFIDKWGYPFCRGRLFESAEQDQGQYNDIKQIFWASGACVALRNTVFKTIGGLDNTFFAHMEEIDLCWRLHNKGYKIMYTGHSVVYHLGGGTLHKASAHKTFLNFRNNLVMLHKNLPSHLIMQTLFARLVLDGIAGIMLGAKEGIPHLIAVLKAHFSYYGQIKTINTFRKNNKPTKMLPNTVYPQSILVAYFLKGQKKIDV